MLDVAILDAKVIDGSGNPWFRADVGIAKGVISHIGKLSRSDSSRVIEARGMVLSPGFIDIHSHADYTLLLNPKADSCIRQGITTLVVGNCGYSLFPMAKGREDDLKKIIIGYKPGVNLDWWDLQGYTKKLEGTGVALNVAPLIGHTAVRIAVMGFAQKSPSRQELETMKSLVDQGMKQGAFGISTGLEYPPGSFGGYTEIVALCKVVSQYKGFYATHTRNRAEGILEATREAIRIGLEAGLPVQISHHVPRFPVEELGRECLSLIDEARVSGLDVTCDIFPAAIRADYLPEYMWGSGPLTAILPGWAFEGGMDLLLQRLADPEARKRFKQSDRPQARLALAGQWHKIVLEHCTRNRKFIGKSFEEIAKISGKDPWDAYFDILLEEGEKCGAASLSTAAYLKSSALMVLKTPYCSIESDGLSLARYGRLKDVRFQTLQSYGYIPLLFQKYVREDPVLTIEDAVRKCTSLPAQRLGLKDRGHVKLGMWADLVVFDPDSISCRATFTEPNQFPDGIYYVLVNGEVVVERARINSRLPGKILNFAAQPN